MILVPPPGALDERLLPLLREWLPARRWFPAKGVEAVITLVGAVALTDQQSGGTADEESGRLLRIVLVRARAGSIDAVLQVPLVLERQDAGQRAEAGAPGDLHETAPGDVVPVTTDLVGTFTDHAGAWRVLDGAAHPAFVRAWLSVAQGPGAELDATTARVVTGEQSNTSVVLDGPDGSAILKVLRAPAPGENPDVDVPRRLVDVGWASVPRPLAWVQAQWPAGHGFEVTGYLGVMSAFVDGAEDGFELACAVARRGESFASQARELGEVVAGMHDALVHAYGTDPDHVGTQGPAEVARSLAQRYSWALSAVPTLAPYRAGVEAMVDEVAGLPSAPARQRVHGDLHLGQVLRARQQWFVTDFEGEPLAPLEQRTRPDLAVRDVAGLLRSLDYAAAVGGLTGESAAAWADEARASLLAGYRAASDSGPARADHGTADDADTASRTETALLRALELDKTLYEAVYESRNRPSWLWIPLAGLDRLVGAPPTGPAHQS
ncbi:maltokinase N-terminal cap-like domain-containing protein [Cellulomonas soli]